MRRHHKVIGIALDDFERLTASAAGQRGEDHETAMHPMRAVWTPNDTWQAFMDRAMAVHTLRKRSEPGEQGSPPRGVA